MEASKECYANNVLIKGQYFLCDYCTIQRTCKKNLKNKQEIKDLAKGFDWDIDKDLDAKII